MYKRQAYECVCGGWEQQDVFAYLRTGLAGLNADECDELENYCFTWNIRGAQWLSERDWRMHPEGWQGKFDEAARERLARINDLRRRAAAPLLALEHACREAGSAREQALALAQLFEDLDLAERLAARADELEASGRLQAADEYARLWDAAVSALEQCSAVLGGVELDAAGFSRLYLLALSQYDVGVIPVSLDMVTAGDMDRMRRRHIKHLIILGASDERLPGPAREGGVFSPEERRTLAELGLPLDAGDAELWREFSLIYNCVCLPSETLTIVSPSHGADGAPARPSFVMSRAERLFGLSVGRADSRAFRACAPGPALELAAAALRGAGDALSRAAAEYFGRTAPERLERLRRLGPEQQRRLSESSARALYGKELRLSPSRVEKLASCRFSYFLSYGLRARPRRPAQFRAPETGSFIHYVLQHVAEEMCIRDRYSHEAERELARVAGPRLPLYAEVLSFTGLARKVEAELGAAGRKALEPGGRLLCMALALDGVYSRLRVYAGARRSPELQLELLRAVDELSAAGLDEAAVAEAARMAGGALGQKLEDLSLVMGAFLAAVGPEHTDTSERLSRLLSRLPESAFGRSGHIYVDGFTDFTGVESRILFELLSRGADMTVCLTLDSLEEGSEVFELSRRTARRLLREARERGVPARTEALEAHADSPADILAEYMLSYTEARFDAAGRVELYTAESAAAECELAASRAIELARAGCRWRDIAVAVRSFEDYRAQLEAAFAYYLSLIHI